MHNQDLGRVSVVARGVYDPAAEYERLDAVSYNGSSFLVRKHCLGVVPAEGEYYMLMAKAGDSTAANAAAVEALAAAGRADTAAGNADQQAAAAEAAAAIANTAAGNANTAAAGASAAKEAAETAASGDNAAAASANQNAAAAGTAANAANAAAGRADQAAAGANAARDEATASAANANAAAAAAQDVVDSVEQDINQINDDLTEFVTNINDDIYSGTPANIFMTKGASKGKGLNTSGSEVGLGDGIITDYIPVRGNTLIYISKGLGSSSYSHWFYDADKNPISYELSNVGGGKYFTSPENAAYIRVTTIASHAPDLIASQCSYKRDGALIVYAPYAVTAVPDISTIISKASDCGAVHLHGDFKINNVALWPGVSINTRGTLTASSGGVVFSANGVSNWSLVGGTYNGISTDADQTLVMVRGCTGAVIDCVKFGTAKNKQIDIGGASSDITIKRCTFSNSNGETGAGVSVFGADCTRITIDDCYAYNCRIGCAINGATHCNVHNFRSFACTLAGISLDGIVTGDGNGARYIRLSDCVSVGTLGDLGGIYLGNGSSYNAICNCVSHGDKYGIRFTSIADHPVQYNDVTGCIVSGATNTAMLLTTADHNTVTGCAIIDCKTYGIDICGGSFNAVNCNKITCHDNSNETGAVAIRAMTDYATISGNIIKGAKTGIYIVSGYADKPPKGFILEGNYLIENRYNFSTNAGVTIGTTSKVIPIS